MDILNLLSYFVSLLVGTTSVFYSYRIYKKTGLSYLGEYLILIILSNIWGFIIWTAPSLISTLMTDSAVSGLIKYKILSIIKWFAFPIHIFHAYLLLLFLSSLTGRKIPGILKKIYFSISFSTVLYVLYLLLDSLSSSHLYNFKTTSFFVTYCFIFIEILLMSYFIVFLRAKREGANLLGYRVSLSGLVTYLVYLSLSSGYFLPWLTVMKSKYILSVAGYYATFCIPLIFVYRYFIKESRYLQKKNITSEDIKLLLSEYKLTAREEEIAGLVFKGLTNKEIEDQLFISHQTVKNYISSIYRKLGVKNRLDLIHFIRSSVEYL